jgi:very-short-patch-repair endonuclease
MRAADYKSKFPGAEFSSQQTLSNMSKAAKIRPPQTEEKKKRISDTMKRVYRETDFPIRHSNENQFGEDNHFFGKTHSESARKIIGEKSTKWLKNAYKTGVKISPFQYLGKGKQTSQLEIEIINVLEPLGFKHDHEISFNKGSYMIDFAHLDKKVGIEIDTSLHNSKTKRNQRKDKFLSSLGWEIHRMRLEDRENYITFAHNVQNFAINLLRMRVNG